MASSLTPIIEYYSGSQVTMFIDDMWVDDAVSYQINITQQKNPIFGYGSQFYDFVAQGKIFVSGVITINFKDPNYLWILLANKTTRERRRVLDQQETRRKIIGTNTFNASNSEALVERLQTAKPTDNDFQEISQLFKEKYWNQESDPGILDPEPSSFNHKPFSIHFLYKGDSAGVIEELSDVELLGKSKIVESNGQPIQEVYNFIARKYR